MGVDPAYECGRQKQCCLGPLLVPSPPTNCWPFGKCVQCGTLGVLLSTSCHCLARSGSGRRQIRRRVLWVDAATGQMESSIEADESLGARQAIPWCTIIAGLTREAGGNTIDDLWVSLGGIPVIK